MCKRAWVTTPVFVAGRLPCSASQRRELQTPDWRAVGERNPLEMITSSFSRLERRLHDEHCFMPPVSKSHDSADRLIGRL